MQPAHVGVRVGVLGRALRRSGPAVALVCLALVAAGCHVPGASNQPAGGGQLTVAVVPGIDTAPLMVAVDDGLFRQQGLTVTVKQFSSDEQVYDALENGTADVAAGDYTSFFNGISRGLAGAPHRPFRPLTLVMDGYDASAGTMQVLALPGTGINSPTALALQGATVGTPEEAGQDLYQPSSGFPYNIETLAAQSVLQSDGISPTAVTWKALPDNTLLTALKNHQVNAILATDPLILEAETQLGAVEVFDACSGVTANLPLSGYFSTTAFANQDGAALTAFRTALIAAQSDAGMRSTVQSVLRGEDMTPQEAALVNIGQYPTFVNVGQVQRVADLMYDTGMITSQILVQQLLFK
jgi:NitT/TauT family transport system substrate-binding protein